MSILPSQTVSDEAALGLLLPLMREIEDSTGGRASAQLKALGPHLSTLSTRTLDVGGATVSVADALVAYAALLRVSGWTDEDPLRVIRVLHPVGGPDPAVRLRHLLLAGSVGGD